LRGSRIALVLRYGSSAPLTLRTGSFFRKMWTAQPRKEHPSFPLMEAAASRWSLDLRAILRRVATIAPVYDHKSTHSRDHFWISVRAIGQISGRGKASSAGLSSPASQLDQPGRRYRFLCEKVPEHVPFDVGRDAGAQDRKGVRLVQQGQRAAGLTAADRMCYKYEFREKSKRLESAIVTPQCRTAD